MVCDKRKDTPAGAAGAEKSRPGPASTVLRTLRRSAERRAGRKMDPRSGKLRFGFFRSVLFAALEAGVAPFGKLVLELFNPAGRVDELQLAGIERVAGA